MIDHFSTLGVARTLSINLDELERHFYDIQRTAHPDRHVTADDAARADSLDKSSGVNRAYRVLRDPTMRLKHLLELYGYSVESSKKVPQSLLMSVMEVQEKLGELEMASDRNAKEKIRKELKPVSDVFENRVDEIEDEIEKLSKQWDKGTGNSARNDGLRDEEKSILENLSQLIAERSYINTLRQSVNAALAGESVVIRH